MDYRSWYRRGPDRPMPASPPDESIGRFLLRFIGVETLLWGFGVMFLPKPQLVVIVMTVGSLMLIGERCSRADCISVIERWFSKMTKRRGTKPIVVVWWMAFALSVTLYWGFHGIFEHAMWMTGNFGEPPFNRWMKVHDVSDGQILEFGTAVTPLSTLKIGIANLDPLEHASTFLSAPGCIQPISWAEFVSIEYENGFATRLMPYQIGPSLSVCFHVYHGFKDCFMQTLADSKNATCQELRGNSPPV
jgi:hypothetical protein